MNGMKIEESGYRIECRLKGRTGWKKINVKCRTKIDQNRMPIGR